MAPARLRSQVGRAQRPFLRFGSRKFWGFQLQFAFGNDYFRRKISSEHFQNAKKIRLRRLLTIFLTKNGYNIDNLLQINGAEGAGNFWILGSFYELFPPLFRNIFEQGGGE